MSQQDLPVPATGTSTSPPRSGRDDLSVRRKAAAVIAVGAARLLARQPPSRIRAVLGALCRRARPATYEQAGRARRDVVAVSRLCAGEGCVPRSLATVLLCRVDGVWPTWCAGIHTFPFSAHAWVAAEGRPVDEPPGIDRYRVIMSIAPHPFRPVPGDDAVGVSDDRP